MLSGWKTYIAAAILVVATGAKALGWITSDIYELIIGVLTSLGLVASRVGSLKTGDVQQSALTTEGKTK